MHFQWEYAWLSFWHIISQQRCEIERWFQRTTHGKLHIRSPMVTWQMTSRDPERSGSCHQYLWSLISQNSARKAVSWNWLPMGNRILGVQCHVSDNVTFRKWWQLKAGSLLGTKYGCKTRVKRNSYSWATGQITRSKERISCWNTDVVPWSRLAMCGGFAMCSQMLSYFRCVATSVPVL